MFLDYLKNSPYLRNLAVLTFRFVSLSVFDKLLSILMEVVNHSGEDKRLTLRFDSLAVCFSMDRHGNDYKLFEAYRIHFG